MSTDNLAARLPAGWPPPTALDAVMILESLAHILKHSPRLEQEESDEGRVASLRGLTADWVPTIREASKAVVHSSGIEPRQLEDAFRLYGGAQPTVFALQELLFSGQVVPELHAWSGADQ
jgi:hypothetical protein